MKREAVEVQYRTFLKQHPDGRISRKSFHSMMKECYPGPVQCSAEQWSAV